MRKWGFFLMIGLLWAGGQGVYDAVRNRAPASLSCAQAASAPPPSAWVHLTGCRVNVLEAAYKTRFGVPSDEIFIPLTPSGSSSTKAVRFVLATKDPDIVAVVKEMAALDDKDKSAVFSFLERNAQRLIHDKDVTGMIQYGIDKDDKIHRRLRKLNKDLVADFVVIDEGRTPSLIKAVLFLSSAIALFLWLRAGAVARNKAGAG